jgi:hypothetical protein
MNKNICKVNKPIRFCVYCKPNEINDATFHYIEIIRGGLRLAGLKDLGVTQEKDIVRQCEIVVSISCMASLRASVASPNSRLIHWFQGIEAVERRYLHPGMGGIIRFVLWRAMELFILRKAHLKIFVSKEMLEFLDGKAGDRQNSLIIPCYNVAFDHRAWHGHINRYKQLNIVYAGSLYPWQCVEDSILTFKELQKTNGEAHLSIFTRETEKARSMCSQHGIFNVSIMSLSPQQLRESLASFSYGFILREDMPINQVSTPTKFNTYLAAGVIPILTEATPALLTMMGDCRYRIIGSTPTAHKEMADKISSFSKNPPDEKIVHNEFHEIFSRNFDDQINMRRIAESIKGYE